MTAEQDILLEAGTNEAEFLEFILGEQSFGINVAKVKAVWQFEKELVTKLPDTPPSFKGTYLYREQSIPLVDLASELNREVPEDCTRQIVIIAEFNSIVTGFLVTGVERIHRVGWDMIRPMSGIMANFHSRMVGVISIDDHEIMIVDMEAIVDKLFPDTALEHVDYTADEKLGRDAFKVVLAEDSSLMRGLITNTLKGAGYTNLAVFEDGLSAWESLSNCIERNDLPHVIISDIEMPRMDGLAFCKNIKSNDSTAKIPLIFFSSLINEQMAFKCKQVGGDEQITKPEIGNLVSLLDKFCGI